MTIKKTCNKALAILAVGAGLVTSAHASYIVSGESKGLQWQASNKLTGAAPGGTATFDGVTFDPVGNPIYHPSYPEHSGVVGMLMQTENGAFICSGTLLSDRRSILTAAHCVSGGAGTANPLSTSVFFQPEGGLAPWERIYNRPPGIVEIDVSKYTVHEEYTGEVIDQNDIAVLTLSDYAPDWARSHYIYDEGDLTGKDFNVAGYGRMGDGAGSFGATGRLRQGYNTYDYAWGNSAFNGFFDGFFGTADVEFSYLSDFDSGSPVNDMSGRIAAAVGAGLAFADTGLGDIEVGVSGGDSGGPNFINGLISGVNSYGLTFGQGFGDADEFFNSGFGEYSGYVPTYIHAKFIEDAMVPAPGIIALLGLSFLGMGLRARRQSA
ncbi:hypothetical protein DRW07_13520 [Alteromonas sediminis]|uniref:Peptidase S1 domain-containing protein n=1 Tax=Alteromonas sediminis TaxID=2259342 RepID=A0A3N5YAK4_9ALTE|nr:trypsin-like serine protease [Alteromonas sediminis]RPJ65825.1 hypothetical protein DRW07_13520 [Alteromonas sediminis]